MSPCRTTVSFPISMSVSVGGATQTLNAFQDALNMGYTKIVLHTRSYEQLIDAIRFISARPNLDGVDVSIIKSKRSFSNGDIIDGRYAIRFVPQRPSSSPPCSSSGRLARFSAITSAREPAHLTAIAA